MYFDDKLPIILKTIVDLLKQRMCLIAIHIINIRFNIYITVRLNGRQ